MLTPDDKKAIDGLFGRLDDASRQYPDRDAEAEQLIADHIGRSPAAPYYMAQTLVMQEHALGQAQSRIAELESELAGRQSGGGLFGSLFGGSQQQSRPEPRRAVKAAQPGGGGFLAGAAQTALGVTGGVLLGSAIAGMLSPTQAIAEEPTPEDPTLEEDYGDEDFGDMGDDDIGF